MVTFWTLKVFRSSCSAFWRKCIVLVHRHLSVFPSHTHMCTLLPIKFPPDARAHYFPPIVLHSNTHVCALQFCSFIHIIFPSYTHTHTHTHTCAHYSSVVSYTLYFPLTHTHTHRHTHTCAHYSSVVSYTLYFPLTHTHTHTHTHTRVRTTVL